MLLLNASCFPIFWLKLCRRSLLWSSLKKLLCAPVWLPLQKRSLSVRRLCTILKIGHSYQLWLGGIARLLVGAAIAGQIFYSFTTDNLKYLALFSVMGASKKLLVHMTLLQALWLALLGWGIGTGAAALLGFATSKTELAFYLSWQLLVITGILMVAICMGAALISMRRIYGLELATVFKR